MVIPTSKFFGIKSSLLRLAGFRVGRNASFCGGGWIYGRGLVVIGDDSWISPRSLFYTHEKVTIQIGNRCDVGPGVSFIPGSHEIASSSRRAGLGIAKGIFIGDGTWLGAGCLIFGGVTIGAGSVIAAGAVVTRDIPPNSLAGGVPCKVIRNLD